MSATAKNWHAPRQSTVDSMGQPTLLDAAKVVVALSGWQTIGRPKDRAFVTSALAIEVLKAAIRREENPTFTLAPEALPSGL